MDNNREASSRVHKVYNLADTASHAKAPLSQIQMHCIVVAECVSILNDMASRKLSINQEARDKIEALCKHIMGHSICGMEIAARSLRIAVVPPPAPKPPTKEALPKTSKIKKEMDDAWDNYEKGHGLA